jgi:hypothetical protein
VAEEKEKPDEEADGAAAAPGSNGGTEEAGQGVGDEIASDSDANSSQTRPRAIAAAPREPRHPRSLPSKRS